MIRAELRGQTAHQSAWRGAAFALAFIAAYVLLDWVSFIYPIPPASGLNITPWNPPPAMALVLLLLRGRSWSPLVLVSAFLADGLVRHFAGPWPPMFVTEIAEALIYGRGAWFIRNVLKVDDRLSCFRDVVGLIGGSVLTAGAMALAYVGTYWTYGSIETPALPDLTMQYWLGDTIGVLVFAPFILIHRSLPRSPGRLKALPGWSAAGQILTTAFALWTVFFRPNMDGTRVFYLVFMPLIWIAATGGLNAVVVALVAVQISVIAGLSVVGGDGSVIIQLQILMLTLTVTSLFLGALISERERARKAVAKGRDRLRAIIEMSPDGMLVVDENGRIDAANSAFGQMAELVPDEVQGQLSSNFIGAMPPIGESEASLRRRQGGPLAVEIAVAVMEVAGGRNHVMTFRDITPRKQAEERRSLRRANLEMMTRNVLTEEIAAGLAHELNQPLSAVIGYTGACRRLLEGLPGTPPRVMEHLANAALQAERAGSIIGRLRDFFRNGKVSVEPVPVRDLVEDVLTLVADEIARSEATVEVAFQGPDDMTTFVDRMQIEQVLINLIRNGLEALAKTDPAERILSIRAVFDEAAGIRITVADNGDGIAAEIADSLFRPFFSTRSGGMGLGLPISRTIAQGNAGRLWNEPPGGRGAVFHLCLPSSPWNDIHAA